MVKAPWLTPFLAVTHELADVCSMSAETQTPAQTGPSIGTGPWLGSGQNYTVSLLFFMDDFCQARVLVLVKVQ